MRTKAWLLAFLWCLGSYAFAQSAVLKTHSMAGVIRGVQAAVKALETHNNLGNTSDLLVYGYSRTDQGFIIAYKISPRDKTNDAAQKIQSLLVAEAGLDVRLYEVDSDGYPVEIGGR